MPGELNVDIQKSSDGYVDINMNLEPYINAFHNRNANPREFRKLKNELENKVTRASANSYWLEIFDLCTDEMSDEERDALSNSPVVEVLEEHFIEILMNSIDEAIQANHADAEYQSSMNMRLMLDADRDPGLVSFYLMDSGRGYPPKFLNKVQSTDEARQQYICRTQRTENLQKMDAHVSESQPYDGPDLVGGHGLGMRHFLADAQNDQLVGNGPNKKLKHVYPKSEASFLDFSNLQDYSPDYTGAMLHFCTPIAPRKTFAEIQEMEEDTRRAHENPSPDTTVDTVSTMGGLSIDTSLGSDEESPNSSSEEDSPKFNKVPMLDMDFLDEKSDAEEDGDYTSDDDSGFSPR